MYNSIIKIILIISLSNLLLIFSFEKIAKFVNIYDLPDNVRKKHHHSTPLLGGLIILIAVLNILLINFIISDFELNSIIFSNSNNTFYFFLTCMSIFTIGTLDDKFSLSASVRLFMCIIIFTIYLSLNPGMQLNDIKFSFLNLNFELDFIGIPFTILCYLLIINALNMYDGINLQLGFFGILILSLLFFSGLNIAIFLPLLISLILFSFLNFNNKTFMGDSGSMLLSFIIGSLLIDMYNLNIFNYADKIFLLLSIPGYDLVRLVILRLYQKKNIFLPDNNHIHHLLSEKLSNIKTNLILLFIVIFPYALSYHILSNLKAIFTGFFIYISLILILKYSKS